jgi:hypothetical protein
MWTDQKLSAAKVAILHVARSSRPLVASLDSGGWEASWVHTLPRRRQARVWAWKYHDQEVDEYFEPFYVITKGIY